MKAVKFPEVNVVYAEEQEEYASLPVFRDNDKLEKPITACFELDEEELKQVQESGKIYITILTFGHPLQPIGPSVLNPFNKQTS